MNSRRIIGIIRYRVRVVEAMAAMVLMAAIVRVVPFSWVARFTGAARTCDSGPLPPPTPTTLPRAAAVGRAVNRGAARLPRSPACLAQALAGWLMLKRRGVPSILVLGVARHAGELTAHAWLLAGDGAVCGGRKASTFTPIAAFRPEHER